MQDGILRERWSDGCVMIGPRYCYGALQNVFALHVSSQREDSPSAEIEKLLAEGSHEPVDGCHDNTDADLILAEYFSGDESKAEHRLEQELMSAVWGFISSWLE